MAEQTENTCERCLHWKEQPRDPSNISQRAGLCLQGPPQLIAITLPPQPPLMQVNAQITAHYPTLPPNFTACHRFVPTVLSNGERIKDGRTGGSV